MSATIEITAPFDGAIVGSLPTSSPAEVEQAVATANGLFCNSRLYSPEISTRPCIASAIWTNRGHGEREPLIRVDWMLFAGAHASGHGVGGIPYSIHEMQTEKMMVWGSDALN